MNHANRSIATMPAGVRVRAGRLVTCVTATSLAALAAGCGSAHHDSLPELGATVTAPKPTAPAVTDSDALQARLLAVAQLPPGYTQLPDAGPGNGPEQADHSHTDPPACANVLAAVSDQAPGASAHAAVHYSASNFASIDIDAASYPDNGAPQVFSTLQGLLHRCRSYSGTDADGTPIHYQTGGLDQPPAGDACASFQVHTTSGGLTLYSAATIAVVGSTIVQIVETAPQPVSPTTLTDLTAEQVHHLQGTSGP
jgi:hypothetical protein